MIVGSVQWNEKALRSHSPKKFTEKMLADSEGKGVTVLAFPGFFGELFLNEKEFINFFIKKSLRYKWMYICPGSYFERDGDKIYHTSVLVHQGDVVLKQRQLYLSTWEKKREVSRGEKVEFVRIEGCIVALLLPTDQFYPQISRHMKLKGVELVIAPSAVIASNKRALQISGLWQNVQQNLFFAIESGYSGKMYNLPFSSESFIHAPLEITPKDDGFLASSKGEELLITSEIKIAALTEAETKYNPIGQLNQSVYKNMYK